MILKLFGRQIIVVNLVFYDMSSSKKFSAKKIQKSRDKIFNDPASIPFWRVPGKVCGQVILHRRLREERMRALKKANKSKNN